MRKAFLYIGLALVVLAIFAQYIGVDNDPGWGARRKIVVVTGASIALVCLLAGVFQEKLAAFKKRLSEYLHINPFTQTELVSSVIILFVISIYIYFSQPITGDFENSYNYYGELAIGFKAGQLYLPDEPSPALLSLSNPYNYFLRKEIGLEDFPWDVSLYKEKFYAYWGPAPSLFLTPLSENQLLHLEDHYLALFFACGLFFYSSLIILRYWLNSRKHISIWWLVSALLAIGLVTPVTVMLKEARVYEAAIFGCQFFFIGGCYWVYSSVNDNKISRWKLALAGLHWAFAVGTRITIVPVILFTCAVMAFYIIRRAGITHPKSYLLSLAILGIPLIAAASALGWYNWARFDSIFEFGIKYQLTNVDYSVFKNSFSVHYAAGNLYNYFLHPFKSLSKFPFITRIEYPASNDRLAGLVYLSPAIFLIFAPLLRMFEKIRALVSATQEIKDPTENWLIIIFSGSAAIGMITILTFYFVTMRYVEDFMPSLILLVSVQLIRGARISNRNSGIRTILASATAILTLFTVTANLLVAMPPSGTVYMIELLNTLSKVLGLK